MGKGGFEEEEEDDEGDFGWGRERGEGEYCCCSTLSFCVCGVLVGRVEVRSCTEGEEFLDRRDATGVCTSLPIYSS